MAEPIILYLDQNAWIALARARKSPDDHPAEYAALTCLVQACEAGHLKVPLSFTNIYETSKANDPDRRERLAYVQTCLSQGWVFRGQSAVTRRQLKAFLATSFGMPAPILAPEWFLSDLHFESVDDYDPELFKAVIADDALAWMRANAPQALYTYLVGLDDQVRRAAVQLFSAGTRDLLARMEMRRMLLKGHLLDMRLRAYTVHLLQDSAPLITRIGEELGLDLHCWNDLGKARALELPKAVPAFDIERELAARTEAENRDITENDLRDLSAFATLLPYADIVVAENAFTSRARQAKLDARYGTELLTAVRNLPAAIQARFPADAAR